jgi:hypothetical protein
MTAPTPTPIFFPNLQVKLIDHFETDWCKAILRAVPDKAGNPADCAVLGVVPNPRPSRLVTITVVPSAGAQSPILSTRRVISIRATAGPWS